MISSRGCCKRSSSSAILAHSLIVDAGARIRSLFVQQKEAEITLLPCGGFEHGRMTGVQLDQIGVLDFEWSKGTMQRANFHSAEKAHSIETVQIHPHISSPHPKAGKGE